MATVLFKRFIKRAPRLTPKAKEDMVLMMKPSTTVIIKPRPAVSEVQIHEQSPTVGHCFSKCFKGLIKGRAGDYIGDADGDVKIALLAMFENLPKCEEVAV